MENDEGEQHPLRRERQVKDAGRRAKVVAFGALSGSAAAIEAFSIFSRRHDCSVSVVRVTPPSYYV